MMNRSEIDISFVPSFAKDLLDEAGAPTDEFNRFLVAIRRNLHRHPELGFEEHRTSAFIRTVLEEHGFKVHGPIAQTGLFVDIEGGRPGPKVGYRADIDALPTQDAKSSAYASANAGVAHLCGHDVHTTIALGAAFLLRAMQSEISGTVRIFFQPNEEGSPGGASSMIRAGVLEGLEAVYAAHVDPSLEVGMYGLIVGPVTAATDQFRVEIRSRSTGHSARPHEAPDTMWVAIQICNSVYQLVGRVTDARNPAVLTVCRFRGGEAYNVIPSSVEFGGTLRTTVEEDRETLIQRIKRLATDVAVQSGTSVDVEFVNGSPPVDNNGTLIAHLESTIRDLFGDGAIFHVPRPSMAAEDFAHYLKHVPGALLRVGTFSGPKSSFPLHDAHFDIDERAIAPTAMLFARVLHGHLEKRILSGS
jgi:amidohydrolase